MSVVNSTETVSYVVINGRTYWGDPPSVSENIREAFRNGLLRDYPPVQTGLRGKLGGDAQRVEGLMGDLKSTKEYEIGWN